MTRDARRQAGFHSAITEAIHYMERHYASTIEHRELTNAARLSASHFSHMFRMQTGLRPTDYLADIRIRHAKKLLFPGGLSVKQTAREVGFEDEFYFSRRFKQRLGIAPQDYASIHHTAGRTVALSYSGQLLALGITPLGAPQQHLANRTIDRMKGKIVDIGDFFGVDLNAIRRLSPNLIITARELPRLENMGRQLRRIAPVAVYPWDCSDVFGHMRRIAALLDREGEAEAWFAGHLQDVELAREAIKPHVGPDETVAILRIYDGYIGLWSGREFGHVLYHSLGLLPPPEVAALMDKHKYFRSVQLEPEELIRYDSSRLFVSLGQDPASLGYYESLTRHPAWQRLTAVRTDRVYPVLDDMWKFYEPRAVASQLRDAVHRITGAFLSSPTRGMSI
ncbi:helix-turn-helix domain-containing protein [Cohnella fermenti]|uniref:Helix-turn-helix domain-containing protein n=1 Tax=Cohnella fermenti TaxID=2565925 RepID=A0A4S4BQ87_9BACL|nr:helix-turn-helix domain-containing protein [Cohnella fermenti]THF76587.1 helix-turn-helix domain-containing protein [Cohnella fermenti]